MAQTLTALSFWLHSVATVIFIGHHLLFSLIYLPAFARNQENPVNGTILSEISKRSRIWIYASLAIFILTGIYLMFVDPSYLGIGNFNNLWSVMMLVKHILILGMVGMGFWYNGLMRVGPLMSSNSGAAQAISRFRQYSNLMATIGVLVLLLTAVSQTQ
ncbi:MAG: hypothetical protein JW963_14895 [Anaerolineales bacterium]|nr:hypothetical protein [Anaerolineales bacterium]